MHYVIRGTDTGKYVARSGLKRSYTARYDELRIYRSRNAAEADRCPDNEVVEPVVYPEILARV
jgi:hypothetical protein